MTSTLSHTSPRLHRGALWTARVLYVLTTLFMLIDVAGKYFMAPGVADAFQRQGMPLSLASTIATLLLILIVLYIVPATSVLGAVLLTGYFGGACACNFRAGFSPFETLFPVIFGALVWIPIYMLNPTLPALLPLRRSTESA